MIKVLLHRFLIYKLICFFLYFCDLFEKNSSIMSCASRVNQYRLHKGYHYPRSDSTINQLMNSHTRFIEEYNNAIEKKYTHLYALARENSLTNKEQYIQFLNRHSLSCDILDSHPNLINEKFNLIFTADEHLINYKKLKKIVEERLGNNPLINLKLNTEFKKNRANEYDFIIFCGYGLSSKIIPKELKKKYKFQLVEKLVVTPPKSLANTSLVIMDGPFMCIDPIADTNFSILGNFSIRSKKSPLDPFFDVKNFDYLLELYCVYYLKSLLFGQARPRHVFELGFCTKTSNRCSGFWSSQSYRYI